ncbi:MAG: hypothetical protein ABIW85_05065, partial [Variovorax sp.]
EMAERSVQDQAKIESADTMPFENYREQYVSASRLGLRSAGTVLPLDLAGVPAGVPASAV